MRSRNNVREVQRLTGCLEALGCFLSRSAAKSLTFFRAFKLKEFDWDKEAENAFQQLTQHLSTLPTLISPLSGEMLYVYLAVSEYALSVVILADREDGQHLMYFASHAF